MLPGIRILFAITLLSVSVLIFGLGAAAFLRSAHENFASAASWGPIETPATARVDLTPATLALLRVEPEVAPALPVQTIEPRGVISAPVETKTPPDAPVAASAALDAPRTDQAEAPATVKAAEPAPAPVLQASPPQPEHEQPVIAIGPPEASAYDASVALTAIETKTEVKTPPEAKAATEAKELPAPTAVAALGADKDPAATSTAEPAASTPLLPAASTPSPAAETPASVTATAPGADTLKADDKAIDPTPAAKIAALGEPALAEIAPLPAKDVKVPAPRVDPAVIEARRKQVLAERRARARAHARRVAAARARAATQAKTAPSDPFGTPANTTTRARTN